MVGASYADSACERVKAVKISFTKVGVSSVMYLEPLIMNSKNHKYVIIHAIGSDSLESDGMVGHGIYTIKLPQGALSCDTSNSEY